MRQVHHAGDKCFVDYAGQKPRVDPAIGEITEVELFVAVLGASNYTDADAGAAACSLPGAHAAPGPQNLHVRLV